MRTIVGKILLGISFSAICASFALAQETLEELNRRIEKLNQDIAQTERRTARTKEKI